MFLRIIILYYCLRYVSFALPPDPQQYETCLLGYMTDFQQWVDEVGRLRDHVDVEKAIDLSLRANPVPVLQQKMLDHNRNAKDYVKYLSLARCRLSRVPPIFRLLDKEGRYLSDTLQYLSFYGNSFVGVNVDSLYFTSFNATSRKEESTWNDRQVSSVWSSGFERIKFPKLKELDLRNCSIQVLGEELFNGMGNLEALYIGENKIWYIDSTAFLGLNKLTHLDFSRNKAYDEKGVPKSLISNYSVFQHLKKLVSLDMSYTKLSQNNLRMFRSIGKNLKSLSICRTEVTSLPRGIFNRTSLELLDLSGNTNILTFNHPLEGIEDSLMILNARETGLSTMEIFRDFHKIEILALSANEINNVSTVLESMTNLSVLDLCRNRLTSWFNPMYSLAPNLKLLTITENNINVITEEMIDDLKNIDYIAMGGNFLVCNCHAKDFFKMAFKNEKFGNDTFITKPKNPMHHLAYDIYNYLLKTKLPLRLDCDENCLSTIEDSGRFRIIDEFPEWYQCLKMPEGRTVSVTEVAGCSRDIRDTDFDEELAGGIRKLLVLLIIPCILLPIAIMFVFRSHIRYFLITIRNSAMLSLINKNDVPETERIFNYDVFVSYCNEDRAWVLDHLLPHMEAECSISACLHERDFQVGLSILENIVSCMDRSRSIMLILSQRFLLSQWCQFEMHLAQHRLLETRREDLTLVLLEDIPRRLRPNTLHYLMLTKTYIVWPKDESERHLFWRRLKKTLISQKAKPLENVSLA